MEMDFKYCRIQGKVFSSNTKAPKGVFSILHQMVQRGEMEQEDADLFFEINDWFANVLPWPPHCKRQEKVICYFKTENSQMMMKMIKPMLWLLDRYKRPYYVVYTNTPGKIVYEDEYQVAVQAGENLVIEDVPSSWSPEE